MQPKLNLFAGSAVLAGILVISFYGLGQSLASGGHEFDDHDLDHEHHEEYGENSQRSAMTMNTAYAEECGSCHMAYPAMLLPPKFSPSHVSPVKTPARGSNAEARLPFPFCDLQLSCGW